ncbi:MAG: hypothetical protein DSZ03_02710, partial [Sulfurimonas sp.]
KDLKMIDQLPTKEWLDDHAQQEPEQEFVEHEVAIENTKEDRRKNQEELQDVITSIVNIKPEALEKEHKDANEKAHILTEEAEKALATTSDIFDTEINTQLMLDSNLVALTTGGAASGRYYDYHPYHGWGKSYIHNEGGVTRGSSGFNLAANKMFPYARARGDGSGISDDNDVTTSVKLYFAFFPKNIGHIRALVSYTTRGWYQIYSNDKWYNSKEALIDLEIGVRLYQNVWTGSRKKDVFSLHGDNINRKGRIDGSGNFFSESMAVGANKWVIAEVSVRAHVETEGSGSTAQLNFKSHDFIRIPYVRFDFS